MDISDFGHIAGLVTSIGSLIGVILVAIKNRRDHQRTVRRDELETLREIIDLYHEGLMPLIVPVTLMNHYVRKYDQPYLKGQWYLNPHPIDLQLRNQV